MVLACITLASLRESLQPPDADDGDAGGVPGGAAGGDVRALRYAGPVHRGLLQGA